MMKYDLVIFDLDGTVLDTLADLSTAVNHALMRQGFPIRTLEDARRFVGNGVAKLIERAVPTGTPSDVCTQVLADFKAYYSAHMNDQTCPYPAIPEMLGKLRAAGMKVGINSNKFDAAVQSLCQIHFAGLYDVAVGESTSTPKKPDPTAALGMMARFGISAARTIFIGDSAVDLATAHNAGCDVAWVAWGFRRREEMDDLSGIPTFDSIGELEAFLL